MKNMKKQYKIATIAATLGLSLAAVGIGAFAYLNDNKTAANDMTTGSVGVDLVEDFDTSGGEEGTTETNKTFWGVATGSKKSLARASIFVSVEAYNEDTSTWEVYGQIPANAVTYDIDYTGWNQGEDGYYYYGKVLEPNPNPGTNTETTPDTWDEAKTYMTSQIKITNVAIDDYYSDLLEDRKVRINMLVNMETCQATNGAYHLSWGDIDEDLLPEGVYVSAEDFAQE